MTLTLIEVAQEKITTLDVQLAQTGTLIPIAIETLGPTVVTLHYSTPHTLWGCAGELASALAAATILADAAVTHLSPKLPKMCRVGR